MSRKNEQHRSHDRAYVIAFVVSLVFWLPVVGLILFAARLHLIGQGFLNYSLFFLPLSPLMFVWLHFLFKALIPITGGMPVKGFRQYVLVYAWFLILWLYWVTWAIVFDITVPSLGINDRQFFLPLIILAVTQVILSRNTKYIAFLNRIFRIEQDKL